MTAPARGTLASAEIHALEQGDHLTRAEFERRYEAMPELKKAELIEGVVYIPSPARWRKHARPHANVIGWLGVYQVSTPGVDVASNASVRLDLDNEPQPDAAAIIDPACDGRVEISEDDYVEGAPELIAEIAASTVSIDLNMKFVVYRRNRVQEYIVWRVLDRTIDWFVLRQTQYERLQAGDSGIYKSEVFPGLWLDAAAMVRGDLAKVLEVLQEGINSPEHAAFVLKLQQAANKPR